MQRFVPKLNDRDLIRAFRWMSEQFVDEQFSLVFKDSFDEQIADDVIGDIREIQGYSVRSAVLEYDGTNWTLLRREDPHAPVPRDLLNVTFSHRLQNHLSSRPKDKRSFFKYDALLFQALDRPLVATGTGPAYAAIHSHSAILDKMESVAAHLIEDTDSHRKALDEEHIQNERRRQEALDAMMAEARKRLEDESARAEADIAKRRELLDQRESSLNELKKQLDDRNNTHVRRDIRSSLLQLTKERLDNFNISGTTKKQYLAVNAASIIGFVSLAGASAYYGTRIQIDPTTHAYSQEAIALIIKSGSYAAAAIALGSWYLGWLNRWLQRIADSEFRLQQFRLDIERASWLAETVLEWKSSSQEPFPELLAGRLSAGLFQSSGSDADGPKTPASHLAEALFGAASSAKLRMGENELTYDRKGLQRLDE